MATFYAVPRSRFPSDWEETLYSFEAFLREIEPHAVAVNFDQEDDCREIFRDDWTDGTYPEVFYRWAYSVGSEPDNFFFIVAGDIKGQNLPFPRDYSTSWGTWPALDNFATDTGRLEFQIKQYEKMLQEARETLARIVR